MDEKLEFIDMRTQTVIDVKTMEKRKLTEEEINTIYQEQ